MTALLLAPHFDDETLFAAYTVMRELPDVIVCLRPENHDENWQRNLESTLALRELCGLPPPRVWPMEETGPDFELAELWLRGHVGEYDRVFAPAVEPGGHEHHNGIGQAAIDAFGPEIVTGYTTYTRAGGRSTGSVPVVPTPGMIAAKHRALACYASQIEDPKTRPWFTGGLDEWYA